MVAGAWKLEELDLRYLALFARARDGRCGWVATVWREQPSSQDLTIELGDVADVTARLVDHEGKPLPNVMVKVDILDRSEREKGLYDEVVLPRSLAVPFEARTDGDGRFVVKGIPRGAKVRALVDEPLVGRPLVFWDPAKVSTLVLDRRLGAITGRLVPPEGKELRGSVKLGLSRMPAASGTQPADGAPAITVSRSIPVRSDGRFEFAGLPPGSYSLTPDFGPDAPYAATQDKSITLEPGRPSSPVEVALRRLPIVSGRVIDETTGSGVAGVGLVAYQLQGNSLQYGRRTKTDGSGKYAVAVEPGMTTIHPDGPPKGHLGIYQELCPKVEVKTDQDWPDLKLARAAAIDGRVVDPAGTAVAGAEVRLVVPGFSGFMGDDRPPPVTGADGSFRLDQLDPTDRIPVRARTADATTDGAVVIRPAELNPRGETDRHGLHPVRRPAHGPGRGPAGQAGGERPGLGLVESPARQREGHEGDGAREPAGPGADRSRRAVPDRGPVAGRPLPRDRRRQTLRQGRDAPGGTERRGGPRRGDDRAGGDLGRGGRAGGRLRRQADRGGRGLQPRRRAAAGLDADRPRRTLPPGGPVRGLEVRLRPPRRLSDTAGSPTRSRSPSGSTSSSARTDTGSPASRSMASPRT